MEELDDCSRNDQRWGFFQKQLCSWRTCERQIKMNEARGRMAQVGKRGPGDCDKHSLNFIDMIKQGCYPPLNISPFLEVISLQTTLNTSVSIIDVGVLLGTVSYEPPNGPDD